MTDQDFDSQYSRCSAPIEVSVETDFQTTLCIEDGPIYAYEPLPASRISVILHFDPPSSEGLQVKSKTFEIPSSKSGVLLELLRNHPERIVQWCAENGNSL
jgi:hypothetical protein